jgi:hypothetical protein
VDHDEVTVSQLDSHDFQWNAMLAWAEEQKEIPLICHRIRPVERVQAMLDDVARALRADPVF